MTPQRSPGPGRTPWVIALTLWCYRRLLLLHPPAFRGAFGPSILQVLRATCDAAYRQRGVPGVMGLWGAAFADALHGAIAEHIEAFFTTTKGHPLMQIYRRSASTLFGAYVVFVLAGIGFAKQSEEVMKSSLPSTHPLLAITYGVVAVGAVLSLLAIVVGGLPVAIAAARDGWAKGRRDIVLRFAVPPLVLLGIAGAVWAVTALHLGGDTAATIHTPGRFLTIGALLAIFVVGAFASTAAVLGAIARSDIDETVLRFTFVPGVLATVVMGGVLVAALAWSISLWQFAPARFWGNEGLLATSTLLGMSVYLLLMVGATVVAIRAIGHEFTARRGTGHPA